MTINNVRVTASHLWLAACLIGFLPVAQVDQAWLGRPQPGSAPPTRSERARQPWPLLVTMYVLACGIGCLVTTIRSKERDLDAAANRPQVRGRGGVGAALGRAARMVSVGISIGMIALLGGFLLGSSIGQASRQRGWPAGKHTGIVVWVVLSPYAALTTYWCWRLWRVLGREAWGDANPKLPATKPPRPRGFWDSQLDEV